MARFAIQTKQIADGSWLGPWKNKAEARSKVKAVALAQAQFKQYHCPKRAINLDTGEVIHTVGDDAEWEAYAARCNAARDAS